jgi:PAS domain-containing protein
MKVDPRQLPIFFVAVDHQARVIEWNPKAAEITRLPGADALEKDIEDCLNGQNCLCTELSTGKGIKSIIIDVLQSKDITSHEYLVPVGDREYQLLLTISALYDEVGLLLGAMLVGQEIKRKDFSGRNRVVEDHDTQFIIEDTSLLVVGIDSSNGLINVWNSLMAKVTGFSKEECLGKDFIQVCEHPTYINCNQTPGY